MYSENDCNCSFVKIPSAQVREMIRAKLEQIELYTEQRVQELTQQLAEHKSKSLWYRFIHDSMPECIEADITRAKLNYQRHKDFLTKLSNVCQLVEDVHISFDDLERVL